MTSQGEKSGSQLKPPVEAVRSHYDKSNEFFKLWLDPSMTYSCGYFDENPDPQHLTKTLEEAQYAKRKLALDKLNLEPGMKLLDIGSGWGSTMRHAVQEYDVDVIGLTLSENQYAHCVTKFEEVDSPRRKEVRIQGWEQFDEPIDRIVSLGAFEHFADGAGDAGYERYGVFFKKFYSLLPDDGRMLLHTILGHSQKQMHERGITLTMSDVRFTRFIATEIFPGGQLPTREDILERADVAGFSVEKVQLLREHYERTLNIWAANLEANREKAIAIQSQEVYDRFMHYLTGCENFFRKGISNVGQFALTK